MNKKWDSMFLICFGIIKRKARFWRISILFKYFFAALPQTAIPYDI